MVGDASVGARYTMCGLEELRTFPIDSPISFLVKGQWYAAENGKAYFLKISDDVPRGNKLYVGHVFQGPRIEPQLQRIPNISCLLFLGFGVRHILFRSWLHHTRQLTKYVS